MTPAELLVQAAVRKDLLSAAEGEQVLATAMTEGRDVGELLVERGILTERTVTTLRKDVARHESASAPTQAHPPPPEDPDATVAMDPTVAAPAPEDVPARLGEFEVGAKLGQGGMGAVYRARQVSLDRDVALKVISPRVAGDPEARQRFIREAKAAAAINHPHVITIHQVGEDQGQVYMAMELVTGGDVDDLLATEGGVLPERRSLELVRDACKGLAAIEAQGLIHRDIKPANLFLTADGSAKLADLGMARSQAGDDKVTQSGVIVGTPAYMSPEQAEGETCDIRTDVYALGATLFRLCVGHPPFEGSSALRVMTKVLNDPVPNPRKANPKLSDATSQVIRRCLAKRPEQRYASAAALLQALEQCLERLTAPAARWGRSSCALLILFVLAACSLCTGVGAMLTVGAAFKDLSAVRRARVISVEELASARGEVFLEAVRVEADGEVDPDLVHAGERQLALQTWVRSPNERRDNLQTVKHAEGLRVGGRPVELVATVTYHGLHELDVTTDDAGEQTVLSGIPFDGPVSLFGRAWDGGLQCQLVTTAPSRQAFLDEREREAGVGNLLSLFCTLVGLVGLALCVLLARKR